YGAKIGVESAQRRRICMGRVRRLEGRFGVRDGLHVGPAGLHLGIGDRGQIERYRYRHQDSQHQDHDQQFYQSEALALRVAFAMLFHVRLLPSTRAQQNRLSRAMWGSATIGASGLPSDVPDCWGGAWSPDAPQD